MPQKPPLSVEELHQIGQRNKGNADVKALLWEIKRLRDELEQKTKDGHRDAEIISRCYQIARSLPDQKGSILGMLIDDLRKKMAGHPIRIYQDSISELIQKPHVETKPGDDDE